MNKEEQLVYRIIEYGIKKEIIVKGELFNELSLTDVQQHYFDKVLISDRQDRIELNHIMVIYSRSGTDNKAQWQYRLTPSAMFNYNDYVELKEARINAKSGRNFAIGALIVSLISIAISTLQTYYTVNTPKLEKVKPLPNTLAI